MGGKLGNKFFDKIIQVPFTLPMVSYDLTEYIKELRPSDEELVDYYNIVVTELTDKNPRAVKRLFSMLFLYEKIEEIDGKHDRDKRKVLLLAILAYQLKDWDGFSQLLKAVGTIDKDKIAPEDISRVKKMLIQSEEVTEKPEKVPYSQLGDLLEKLYKDENGIVADEIYEILIELLKGAIGAIANVNGKDIPDAVYNSFRKMNGLILSERGVEANMDLVKGGQIHSYKKMVNDELHDYFKIAIWKDSYFNINLYTEFLPGIIDKVKTAGYKEIADIKQARWEKNKKLCYYKIKSDKQVCIANINDDVPVEELEKLYQMCKECM